MQNNGGMDSGWRSALATRRQRLIVTALLAALGLLVAACSAESHRVAIPAAQLTITPANGTDNAQPNQGVTVTASHGVIKNVTVTEGADPLSGSFNASGTTWQSVWALQPSSEYVATATAVSSSGKTVTETSSFRTLTPSATVQAQTVLGDGQDYGVGMPIAITFSRPVTNKVAVERSLQLTTSKPVTGAWYWDGDETVAFRTRTYWPEHTRVSFVAHLDGVEAAPGVYGTAN
ncbi:MAG TPA: Ig-like domain-containing protein, partial [Streptosporangiaceae bacterium]|nr:Ig-like domain-containing protein [Streptosporangiaceae bacterium]